MSSNLQSAVLRRRRRRPRRRHSGRVEPFGPAFRSVEARDGRACVAGGSAASAWPHGPAPPRPIALRLAGRYFSAEAKRVSGVIDPAQTQADVPRETTRGGGVLDAIQAALVRLLELPVEGLFAHHQIAAAARIAPSSQ
jgi:hypothetical protein